MKARAGCRRVPAFTLTPAIGSAVLSPSRPRKAVREDGRMPTAPVVQS